jgi:NAD(P)-dependent dehydrogenase (short-subunit alcohol dehydrogenase family)
LFDQTGVLAAPDGHAEEPSMSSHALSGTTALVTGSGRGFGRAIAIALSKAGANVVGVARNRIELEEVRGQIGDAFTPVVADVTDPVRAGHLIDEHRPRTLVLNAGATPLSRPLQHHTWESFSRCWEVDVKHVFHWTREALLAPLEPGSTVIALSSGAAIKGSPISGGYAGAKATIRFVSAYAAEESERAGLGIRFAALLPKLTPATGHGAVGVKAYAARVGQDVDTFLKGFGDLLAPDQVGQAVVELATDSTVDQDAYFIAPDGGLKAAG